MLHYGVQDKRLYWISIFESFSRITCRLFFQVSQTRTKRVHQTTYLCEGRRVGDSPNRLWEEYYLSAPETPKVLEHLPKDEKRTVQFVVIVVSPLDYIRQQQVSNLTKSNCGVTAAAIGESEEKDQGISEGKFNVVHGSADQWLSERWKKCLCNRLLPPSVSSCELLLRNPASSSWNKVMQLTIFLAHFLHTDGRLAAATLIFIPTLLTNSDRTMLSAVQKLFTVNSLFFVGLNRGTELPKQPANWVSQR